MRPGRKVVLLLAMAIAASVPSARANEAWTERTAPYDFGCLGLGSPIVCATNWEPAVQGILHHGEALAVGPTYALPPGLVVWFTQYRVGSYTGVRIAMSEGQAALEVEASVAALQGTVGLFPATSVCLVLYREQVYGPVAQSCSNTIVYKVEPEVTLQLTATGLQPGSYLAEVYATATGPYGGGLVHVESLSYRRS